MSKHTYQVTITPVVSQDFVNGRWYCFVLEEGSDGSKRSYSGGSFGYDHYEDAVKVAHELASSRSRLARAAIEGALRVIKEVP